MKAGPRFRRGADWPERRPAGRQRTSLADIVRFARSGALRSRNPSHAASGPLQQQCHGLRAGDRTGPLRRRYRIDELPTPGCQEIVGLVLNSILRHTSWADVSSSSSEPRIPSAVLSEASDRTEGKRERPAGSPRCAVATPARAAVTARGFSFTTTSRVKVLRGTGAQGWCAGRGSSSTRLSGIGRRAFARSLRPDVTAGCMPGRADSRTRGRWSSGAPTSPPAPAAAWRLSGDDGRSQQHSCP